MQPARRAQHAQSHARDLPVRCEAERSAEQRRQSMASLGPVFLPSTPARILREVEASLVQQVDIYRCDFSRKKWASFLRRVWSFRIQQRAEFAWFFTLRSRKRKAYRALLEFREARDLARYELAMLYPRVVGSLLGDDELGLFVIPSPQLAAEAPTSGQEIPAAPPLRPLTHWQ